MANGKLLQALSFWNLWGQGSFQTGIVRDARESLLPWLDRPEIVAICGMRRCGKSTLMRQLVRALVDRGVDEKNTLFVNFEEPVFLERGLDTSTLDRVFDTYSELVRPSSRPYVLLDEIHNVSGWERWARSLAETGRARFVVSGSSSQLLDPDLATVLTGRHLTHTLWPLSFRELLRFRGLNIGNRTEVLSKGPAIRRELARYLQYGGLPEVVLEESADIRNQLLKQYFRDILYRDVVSRHEIRDVRALETIAHHYLVNTANLATYNRLKNIYGLAMDQIRSYTGFLEESFLIREVPRFSYKASAQARAPRKVYAIDVGLRNAVSFRFSEDLGRLAETAAFNHLVRDPDTRIFYFKGRGECDFITWRASRPLQAIQVCYESEGEPPPREVAGLEEAMQALELKEGLILTREFEHSWKSEDRTIEAIPLWRWLCLPTGTT